MKREIISISDNGMVTVAGEIRMTIYEIAELFGVYCQSTKRIVRSIEKSGIADGDYSMTCTVEGLKVCPEYYGLDMVVAVAFRVQTANAKIFRAWMLRRAVASTGNTPIFLQMNNLQSLN